MLKAAGVNKAGNIVLLVQLLLLTVANCWNVTEIINPNSGAAWFQVLGFSWPVAYMFLIVTGIFILRANKLKGWRRVVPLLAGLWFPFMLLIQTAITTTLTGLILAGIYAALTYAAMGLALLTRHEERFKRIAIR
ncbi:MAG TPA: hypothetical protein VM187_18525 [Niastella sp.]|nr:hypothetical protein [Niastella sp.]